MKDYCIIFSIDDNKKSEYGFSEMGALLSYSLKMTIPHVDVYCGLFTNNILPVNILNILKANNVNIIKDNIFNTYDVSYFLRNYTMYYFSHIYNLLNEYKTLIYIDVDCIVLNDFLSEINDEILIEEVPESIKTHIEINYNDLDISKKLYFNWMQYITNTNKYLYDMDYTNIQDEKQSDIMISDRIEKSNLIKKRHKTTSYYPVRKLSKNTTVFHYDGFIDSGSFFKLKDIDEKLYNKYLLIIEKILKIKLHNDEEYWNEFTF